MTFRMDGFDELQRKLQGMADNLREIEGTNEVPMSEVLTPEFLPFSGRAIREPSILVCGFEMGWSAIPRR